MALGSYDTGLPNFKAPDMQAQMGAELDNAFKRVQNKYAEPLAQSQIAKDFAQAQKSMQPERGDFEKAVSDVARVQEMHGADSEIGRLANDWLQRKAQGAPGLELTTDPSTGAVSLKLGNRGGGNGKGSQVVDGKFVTPPSQGITNEQQGKQLSNVVRDYLSKAVDQPFIGQDSNLEAINTLEKYKETKDPIAGEKLVQAAVSFKLIPEVALQQLQSQGVRATVAAQKHQRDAIMLGWPASLKFVVDNLPSDLQKEAKVRHDKILQESHRLQTQHYAEGTPFELEQKNQMFPESSEGNEDLSSWSTDQILEALNNAE